MAIERKWAAVPPTLFISNGGAQGQVTLTSTSGIKVKQRVVLSAIGLPDLTLEVKRVLSSSLILVGYPNKPITDRADVSLYTTAASSFLFAEEQDKAQLTKEDRLFATYEQEPTVAWRVVDVDQYGNFYTSQNPYPVQVVDSGSVATYNPIIDNVIANNANTEYNYTFPSGTKRAYIKVRDGMAKMRLAWVSGETNTFFITVGLGCNYYQEIDLSNKTIYYQVDKPGKVIEFEYWIQS